MTLCDPPRFCFSAGVVCHACTRDQMIRLVVSQQWAVMILLAKSWKRLRLGNDWLPLLLTMQKLPCAVDVVDGLL